MKRLSLVIIIGIVLANFAQVNANAGPSCVANSNRNTISKNSLICNDGLNNKIEIFVPKQESGYGYTRGKTSDGRNVICKYVNGRTICK